MANNSFLNAATKHDTVTINGALSNSSSGSALIDQFGQAGCYRGRAINDVFADQSRIWDENAELALRFPFYLRLVTRKTKMGDGVVTEKVQNGQGVRDEAFKRLLWVAMYHSEEFYKNLWLLPIIGSWKDVWTILEYDITNNLNCLDKERVFNVIASGFAHAESIDLIKKFMPRIKSVSKTKTESSIVRNNLAKEFAKFLGWNCGKYNKFKSSGTAHDFQKLICSGKYNDINWNHIPGRALNLLANSKFLSNHDLVETYTEWVKSQPMAKFTGYVHELALQFMTYQHKMPLYQRITLDKQFETLINTAKQNDSIKENVWCCLDTSGSMERSPRGVNARAIDICLALGVFFSTLNEGAFNKNVVMFDSISRVKQLSGSFCDMMSQIVHDNTAWGSTNFQSVIDLIIQTRKENPNIPLEDYPSTLLVVSDMGFNPYGNNTQTNYEAMKSRLAEVFPTEFVESMKFIWWDVLGKKSDVPATMDDGGCYLISGYDGSIVTMLTGTEVETKIVDGKKVSPTMEELVSAALSQEVLLNVTL